MKRVSVRTYSTTGSLKCSARSSAAILLFSGPRRDTCSIARASARARASLPQGARASGYALLDLSAGYRVGRLQLDLQVDNVLNGRWKEGESNYASRFNRDDPRSAIPALHFAAGPPLTVRLGATLWL